MFERLLPLLDAREAECKIRTASKIERPALPYRQHSLVRRADVHGEELRQLGHHRVWYPRAGPPPNASLLDCQGVDASLLRPFAHVIEVGEHESGAVRESLEL